MAATQETAASMRNMLKFLKIIGQLKVRLIEEFGPHFQFSALLLNKRIENS